MKKHGRMILKVGISLICAVCAGISLHALDSSPQIIQVVIAIAMLLVSVHVLYRALCALGRFIVHIAPNTAAGYFDKQIVGRRLLRLSLRQ